jgi:hypothetical protein
MLFVLFFKKLYYSVNIFNLPYFFQIIQQGGREFFTCLHMIWYTIAITTAFYFFVHLIQSDIYINILYSWFKVLYIYIYIYIYIDTHTLDSKCNDIDSVSLPRWLVFKETNHVLVRFECSEIGHIFGSYAGHNHYKLFLLSL